MKTKKEIEERLAMIKRNKQQAKNKGANESYIINCKLEKLFKWVLEKN